MSKEPLFSVNDPIELLTLWRLVAEAKFQADPDDVDLWGSPYVHALAQRISDAQLHYERMIGNTKGVKRHLDWIASLPNNIVLPVVKAQLKKDASSEWWREKTQEQKLAYAKDCVAPFQPDTDFLENLIREAET